MNKAMLEECAFAFLAGLIEQRSSIFIKNDSRKRPVLHLKIWVSFSLSQKILGWLTSWDLIPSSTHVPNPPLKGGGLVAFSGQKAGALLANCFPYIQSEQKRQEAHIAFLFLRTIQHSGVKLPTEMKEERDRAARELKALHAKARAS